jgi:hypothetical protein
VGGVLAEQDSRLNTAHIRETLDLLERALNQSGLLRVFEAASPPFEKGGSGGFSSKSPTQTVEWVE